MKIGICTWSFYYPEMKSSFEYVDLAVKYGFKALDLTLDVYTKHFDWMNEPLDKVIKHFTELKTYADQAGIIFSQTHAPYAVFPKFLRRDFMKSQIRSIIISGILNAPYTVIHPIVFPKYTVTPLDQEELDYNIRFYKRLIPYLRKYHVKAALENIYDRELGQIRMVYVSNPLNLVHYFEALPKEDFVFCLDTGHLHMAGYKQSLAIKTLSPWLKALHVHDNFGVLDQHFYPFEGDIDWHDFASALAEIQYDGVINLEVKPSIGVIEDAKYKADKLVEYYYQSIKEHSIKEVTHDYL